jgi:hypothetical protein
MVMDFTNQNLQGKRFRRQHLENADFSGTDLRGADFSFAELKGARFVKVKTGITTVSKIWLFLLSLVLSLLSGYIAMVSGRTAQILLQSGDPMLRIGGYITTVFFLVFTIAAVWKGLFKVINTLLPIMIVTAIVMGLFMYLTGMGTGKGAVYGSLALLLMALMFIVGTIARATVGSLGSNLLFLLVALGGGVFGKSVGGGVATMIMAIACAVISKRALADESGKSVLKKIALRISSGVGTSFKNANLRDANFRDAEIRNTDFSQADLSGINWSRAKGLFMLKDKDVLIPVGSNTPAQSYK